MKVILISSIIASLVFLSGLLSAQGLILGDPLEFWDSADIILDGTVISTTKIQADQMVKHNIEVEQYFKNPKPEQMITAYGPDAYNEKWFYPKFFNKGDRVLFYLKKIDDKYVILAQSILATEKCSPRDMIGLSTLPGEPIGRGGPTLLFDPYQTCNGYLYPVWYLASSLTPLKQHKAGIKNEDIKCNDGLIRLIKSTDISPVCVKSKTVQKLVERGWTFRSIEISKDSDLVVSRGYLLPPENITISNKPFHYYTINETLNSAQGEGKKITFHDVTFTFFPRPKYLNLSGFCGSGAFETSVFFVDGTRELLKINIPETECMDKFTKADLTKLTNHTNPQAGLVFYDGKMQLLVSTKTPIVDSEFCKEHGGKWFAQSQDCVGIPKNICEANSGTFNECESYCKYYSAQLCPDVCLSVCSVNQHQQ